MPHDSWDFPDTVGRVHKQMIRLARTYIRRAEKAADQNAIMAWSVVLSRHTRDLVILMDFKRKVMLDLERVPGQHLPEAARESLRDR